MVTEGTKKQAHQKRTKVAASRASEKTAHPPLDQPAARTPRPPVSPRACPLGRCGGRLGDNQATNHNRTH